MTQQDHAGEPDPADVSPPARTGSGAARATRKSVLLRLDPSVHDAVARWASDDLRSVNAQIETLLRRALADAGRLPRDVRPQRRPGRPAASDSQTSDPQARPTVED